MLYLKLQSSKIYTLQMSKCEINVCGAEVLTAKLITDVHTRDMHGNFPAVFFVGICEKTVGNGIKNVS